MWIVNEQVANRKQKRGVIEVTILGKQRKAYGRVCGKCMQ